MFVLLPRLLSVSIRTYYTGECKRKNCSYSTYNNFTEFDRFGEAQWYGRREIIFDKATEAAHLHHLTYFQIVTDELAR